MNLNLWRLNGQERMTMTTILLIAIPIALVVLFAIAYWLSESGRPRSRGE